MLIYYFSEDHSNKTIKKAGVSGGGRMIENMRIAINFDDTLTDTNYSMIDLINKKRKKEDHITFDQFDNSLCPSIWRYSELSLSERILRRVHGGSLLRDVDVVPLASEFINKVSRMGVEVHIITSREDDERDELISFLRRHRIFVDASRIHMGLNNMEKIQKCIVEKFDLYIEDNPKVISLGIRSGVPIVVRDQTYNRNYKNLVRLECFSQLEEACERTLLKSTVASDVPKDKKSEIVVDVVVVSDRSNIKKIKG